MKLVFFSNFINHHQVYVSDELNALTNGNYTFVETTPIPESFRKSGYPDYTTRSYVLQAWRNREQMKAALQLAVDADVALFDGYEALPFEIERYKRDTRLLSFEINERWCKRGIINYLSPRFLKWYYHYITSFRKCNVYKLCCSAYLPNDMYNVCAFKDKCFKWAYLTMTKEFDVKHLVHSRPKGRLQIMWCARFINWKHPKLAIELAKELKTEGFSFDLDMYGSGEMFEEIEKDVTLYQLQDVVHLKGNAPNDIILEEMKKHSIFLITSDRNEGWGAVVNEALSSGCAVVADEQIGAVPYLVRHGVNGRIYKTKNLQSIKQNIIFYINNPQELDANCLEAYRTMTNMWSPSNAAKCLITLINNLKIGSQMFASDGPCSKAYPIK